MTSQDEGAVSAASRRGTVRRLMVATAIVAVVLSLLRPVYYYFDATYNGPYTRAFDREHKSLAESSNLVGKTEADAIRILGEPAEIWEYDRPEGRTTTLAYSPSWFSGLGTFQVHCRGGIVRGMASRVY